MEVSWSNLKRQLCAAGKKWKINQHSMALSYPGPKVRWAAAISFSLKLIVHAFKWQQDPREWPSGQEHFGGRFRSPKGFVYPDSMSQPEGREIQGWREADPLIGKVVCGLVFITDVAPGYRCPWMAKILGFMPLDRHGTAGQTRAIYTYDLGVFETNQDSQNVGIDNNLMSKRNILETHTAKHSVGIFLTRAT